MVRFILKEQEKSMKIMRPGYFLAPVGLVCGLLTVLALSGCGFLQQPSDATDYSQASHWLALPAVVKEVDVFYIIPTAWNSTSSGPEICAIDDPSLLTGAAAAYARQATAFEAVGNVFAPYYRQANLAVLSLPPAERIAVIGGTPTSDVTGAFDFYIQHLNNNRPFILLGHSQGANVLSNLLAGYLKDHPDVYDRMIAAYALGYPITDDYLAANPHLRYATGPDDTGVVLSWNTEAPEIAGANPVLFGMVGRVINPINWKTDETYAAASESLGSFLPTGASPTSGWVKWPHFADAQISLAKGVLICSSADVNIWSPGPTPEAPQAWPRGVYHTFDVPFYYYDIQANALNRVNKYLGR